MALWFNNARDLESYCFGCAGGEGVRKWSGGASDEGWGVGPWSLLGWRIGGGGRGGPYFALGGYLAGEESSREFFAVPLRFFHSHHSRP